MPVSMSLKALDESLRSPFGPPLRAFNAQALLSGLRQNDEDRVNQSFPGDILQFPDHVSAVPDWRQACR